MIPFLARSFPHVVQKTMTVLCWIIKMLKTDAHGDGSMDGNHMLFNKKNKKNGNHRHAEKNVNLGDWFPH